MPANIESLVIHQIQEAPSHGDFTFHVLNSHRVVRRDSFSQFDQIVLKYFEPSG